MKLFKYEAYKVVISEEALALKPFKQIWNRDKTISKDKAIMELSYVYFMIDPRSDYQYLVDKEERAKAVKEGEGFSSNWKPDKVIIEAMKLYDSFKPASALLLEDTRIMVDKFRKKMREIDFDDLEVKELKEIGALIKQIPSLVKDLDEAEKAVASEMREQGGRVRGQKSKALTEDSLDI